VFAVNPNAREVEGDPCYPSLDAIPGGVEAVVIATRPDRAEAIMKECAELGVRWVWMHRAFGQGSVSPSAAVLGRARGITVIDGGCPLMYPPASDFAHKVLRLVARRSGALPRSV